MFYIYCCERDITISKNFKTMIMNDNYTNVPTPTVEWVCITDTTKENAKQYVNQQVKQNVDQNEVMTPSVNPQPIIIEKDRKDNFLYAVMICLMLFLLYNNQNSVPATNEVAVASMAVVPNQMEVIKSMLIENEENLNAPVSHAKLGQKDLNGFIKRFAPVAIVEMHKYDIPASIKMAQGIIESRAGHSKLAVENNNHFGMKCFSKKCSKNHCTNATDDHHKDFFRKYTTVWESWRDHSLLLQGKRYKSLKKYKRDYKKWAKGLKKAGYATDKNYDKKLIDVIEKYQLYKLDKL